MEVVREKKNVLRDIFQMKLKGGELMKSMLRFLHAWKIFLILIPSMTGGTWGLLNGGCFMKLSHQCFNL